LSGESYGQDQPLFQYSSIPVFQLEHIQAAGRRSPLSSILKALKRIEGQPPSAEAFPALPDSIDAKQAVNSTARRRWRRRRIMAMALVLSIAAGGAVIAFQNRKYLISKIFPASPPATNQQRSPAKGEKSKIFKAKISPAAVSKPQKKSRPKRSTQPVKKKTASEPEPGKIRSFSPPGKSPGTAAEHTSRSGSAASNLRPQRKTTAYKPVSPPSSSKKFTPSKKSIAGKRTASRKSVVAPKKKPQARTYARLTDDKLKLQALAWSSDASRRMAVINGRIVREGESTDGYQIHQIRKEDVVVSDGRQSWRLEFGLKK
jgi:hypothetical protein